MGKRYFRHVTSTNINGNDYDWYHYCFLKIFVSIGTCVFDVFVEQQCFYNIKIM